MTTWWCFKHFPFASSSYQNMTCAIWESTKGRKQVWGTQESSGFTPRCSLVPGHRFCQKGRMLCSCPACQSLSPELNVEHVFLILLTKEGVHSWSFMGFVEKAIPFLCYVDWLEEATFAKRSLRHMSFLLARQNLGCKYVSSSEYHWNMMEPWSHPFMRYTPWAFSSWLCCKNMAGPVASYFQRWDS